MQTPFTATPVKAFAATIALVVFAYPTVVRADVGPVAPDAGVADVGDARDGGPVAGPQVGQPDGWDQRARGLEDFLSGALDPTESATTYFTIDPTQALWRSLSGTELAALLAALEPATPSLQGPKPTRPGALVGAGLAHLVDVWRSVVLPDAARRYIVALRRYRSLPKRERDRLLTLHQQRQRLAKIDAALLGTKPLAAAVRSVNKDTTDILALIDGNLSPGQDLAKLLRLQVDGEGLSQNPALRRAQQRRRQAVVKFYELPSAERQARLEGHRATPKVMGAAPPGPAAVSATAPGTPDSAPDTASPQVPPAPAGPKSTDASSTPPPKEVPDPSESAEERQKAANAAEAERVAREAAAQKEVALAAAKAASTLASRQVAEEKARLLGVKEAQQTFKAELNRRTSQAHSFAEDVAAWQKTLAELETSATLQDDVAAAAESLYAKVGPAMSDAAQRLSASLDELADDGTAVPPVGTAPSEAIGATSSEPILTSLRAELVSAERELARDEAKVRWEVAEILQTELSNLRALRNALLPLLGARTRAAMTGFGAAGVEQVSREFSELRLLARYRLAAWPRTASKMLSEARTSPIPWLVYLVKVIALLAVWRWWRRRGDELLDKVYQSVQKARRTSLGARLLASPLWYLRRLHRPLVALVFWAALIEWTARAVRLPELEAVWLIAKWILIGQLVIAGLDAVAARSRRSGSDPLQRLRFRSLRLVGLTVVSIGLLLALVERAVGEGAIYGWVQDLSLFLTLPVIVVLVRWWRPEVSKRASLRSDENPTIAWVAEHAPGGGVTGWFAAALGGLYLLAETLYRWLFQKLAFFDTTRRALAFLARRGSETQLQNRTGLTAIDPHTMDLSAPVLNTVAPDGPTGDPAVFDPNDPSAVAATAPALPDRAFVTTTVDARTADLAAVFDSDESAIIAIVGERGGGKTTFLNRALAASDTTKTIRIRAQPNGYISVKSALLIALGLEPTAELPAIAAEIQRQRPEVICIDQSHRIIRPEIGGLDGFDELVHLARSVGGGTCWAMVFNAPVWMHIKRARGHRAVFHSVTVLPPWNEEEVAELCLKRAAIADLEPSFESLEIPRLPDDDADDDPVARKRRGYFRILWEYSGGNPSIALHFWSKSLFRTQEGQLLVKMFQAPNAGVLNDLPESVYFVLRAVIQREWASANDVVASTRFSQEDVADALAWAQRGGMLEQREGRVRVDFQWYRSVATALRRRHLLTG